MGRPAVSVILPFHGGRADADAIAGELQSLKLAEGDEVIVADNTEDGVFGERAGLTVLHTEVKRSAYAARNIGAEHARSDWLLFVDADCRLRPDLLDRYFDPPPADAAGAVAGQIAGAPDQPGLVPAYMRSRGHLDQERLREHPYRPMAVTANLLVRRAAWDGLGGFAEGTLSGADADFCWRMAEAGWALELRRDASVEHVHRPDLRALLAKSMRDGAGRRWLSRRWAGFPPHPPVARELVRAPGGALVWLVLLQPRRALFKVIDLLFVLAAMAGSWRTNATPTAPGPMGAVRFTDEFDGRGEPGVLVEALRRADVVDWRAGRRVCARFAEDDGPLVRVAALARLAVRRPLRVARGLLAERRGAFAWAPAALRLARAGRGARAIDPPTGLVAP